jgi:ATP-dependent Clp protease ATP-binding subunit ClpA
MFERFTERARRVVVLAQEEARGFRHNYIGTEHILLGLLREEEGLAARVLESLKIPVEEVRAQVARIVGQGDEVTIGQIPFTPRAKRVLELALREALSIGHNYIGTEHILLGLVHENGGVAARILLDFDADAEKIRGEVMRMLSGPGRQSQARSGSPISRMSMFSVPESDPPPIEPIDDATRAKTIGELVDSVTVAKESTIAAQEFERAAELRELEHRLTGLIKRIARAADRDQPPPEEPGGD